MNTPNDIRERRAPSYVRGAARVAVRLLTIAGWSVAIIGALLVLVPALAGMQRYVITGNSMAPEFQRGSIVFSESVPVEDLAVGDIITYQPPAATGVTQLVTHRIIDIQPGEDGLPVLETQGDANDTPDPWRFQLAATEQSVVQHHLPIVGHPLAVLADPSKRVLVIGSPAALIALRALLDLVGVARQHRSGEPDGECADTDDPADGHTAEDHAALEQPPVRDLEPVG
jgi:signal peptidase